MPRFSLASILWLTAIVAVAAAIPRPIHYTVVERLVLPQGFLDSQVRKSWDFHIEVEKQPATITEEILIRGLIVLALLLLVWLGHVAFRRIRRLRRAKNLSD